MSVTRSPSPAPEYDSLGNRINTREKRTRGKLMEERNAIIEKYQVSVSLRADFWVNSTDSQQYARSSVQKLNPLYRPPQEFITAQKFEVRARGTKVPSCTGSCQRRQLTSLASVIWSALSRRKCSYP